jgi:hypothetical protein
MALLMYNWTSGAKETKPMLAIAVDGIMLGIIEK